MKLTFSPTSPFARKVRIAAIELGLIDKIELVPTTVSPTTPNPAYSHDINPLRKLPALIVDENLVIVDSYNITEYLDELAGGKLLPKSGVARWKAKSEHTIIQGMTEAMLLCRYETFLRPKEFVWQGWYDDQWDRAWQGFAHFEERAEALNGPLDITQIALTCALGYADFRFPDCGWRKAFPKLDAFHERMLQLESVKVSKPPQA
ncbi:MAG: glutathione S-transferase [Bradyrhizobiaceae bacterium PARB1]|jgi:glutathione S-transferase|nr:MAG: glutathione S-transferase [Bradyrhizobiaceae bacterium PARB1]